MDFIFPLLFLGAGFFALAFDRKAANMLNCAQIAMGRLWPQWRSQNGLLEWSKERFENWLWFAQLLAVFMIFSGFVTLADIVSNPH